MMKTNKGEIMESRFGMSRKVAPSKCPDCNNKLGPINHGRKFNRQYKLVSPSFVDGTTIYRECSCGCVIQWGCDIGPNHYHQVWKRRHVLPLFDDKQVIQIVDIFR